MHKEQFGRISVSSICSENFVAYLVAKSLNAYLSCQSILPPRSHICHKRLHIQLFLHMTIINSLVYLVLQSPVTPLQRASDVPPPVFNQILMRDQDDSDGPPPKRIPTLLVWPHGGKCIFVEGSWDHWTSKYILINQQ